MELAISPSTVISVQGLRMGYGARILLENASFDVKRGEVLVFLGGSGCGKSSLMKNMIGLYRPMAGNILVAGKSIVNALPGDKAKVPRSLRVREPNGAAFRALT